jgi:hypothetical protein
MRSSKNVMEDEVLSLTRPSSSQFNVVANEAWVAN